MIKVEGISKQFKLYRSPADRLKEIVYRKKYHKDFVALDNISPISSRSACGRSRRSGRGLNRLDTHCCTNPSYTVCS